MYQTSCSRFVALICLSAAVSLPAIPVFGEDERNHRSEDSLRQDALSYTEMFGVTIDEAARRLRIQSQLGELEGELREAEESFAGLWIEHEPTFRIVTRFADPFAEERVRARLLREQRNELIEVRSAPRSLAELEADQDASRHLAKQLDTQVDSDINVFANRVELYAVDSPGLTSRLASTRLSLPGSTSIVSVPRLAESDQTQLRGGERLTGCTGGFTVRRSNGDVGISTAAHCGNTHSALGSNLPFRGEDQTGNQDVQWHSACNILDVSNQFNSGIGFRACTGTRHRNSQAIGSFVCKWGRNTGRTCGTIQSKSYAPSYVNNASSTFVRVNGTNLRGPGDSGGPWFVESLAYGTHSGSPGSDPNDALYMPINYISSLGVSVLTFDPPGPGCTLCTPSGALCQTNGQCCSGACVPLGFGGFRVCS